MAFQVSADDPRADTEWNDILRRHRIIPERPPSPTEHIQHALLEARRLAYENRLEGNNLDQLDELEDEEDEAFLEKYRQQRIAELRNISTTSIYNQVYPIQKPDYAHEVTESSKLTFVFVLLTSSFSTNIESALAIELWRGLASTFGHIKFCQMTANLCIEAYPDRNTPTILVYKDGDIQRQVVTLREMHGERTSMSDFETLLLNVGALNQNDIRLSQHTAGFDIHKATYSSRNSVDQKYAALNDDDGSDLDI